MGKVNTSAFGGSSPKLTPDDLEGDAAILTVVSYEEVDVDDEDAEGGKRKAAILTFEETGDRVLWLNKGMVEALVERLGDESDHWTGAKVPVEKYTARFRGQKFNKVRVLPAEEWPGAFKEAGVKMPSSKVAPAPAKRGGKR